MTAILPKLDHLQMEDFICVYEPSDDTYLLCDALEQDRQLLVEKRPSVVIEIGSGSGTVISFVANLLKSENVGACCWAVDINPIAIEVTCRTAAANEVMINTVVSDLGSNFRDNIVDILIFNPPYVPTPSEEIGGSGIEASWAGGIDGREVIDRFLPLLNVLLAPGGLCYLVLVEDNRPAQIAKLLRSEGFEVQIVLRRQAVNENLQIMRIEAPLS